MGIGGRLEEDLRTIGQGGGAVARGMWFEFIEIFFRVFRFRAGLPGNLRGL